MTDVMLRFRQSSTLAISGDCETVVIPDLVSERSGAESVGNPCLASREVKFGAEYLSGRMSRKRDAFVSPLAAPEQGVVPNEHNARKGH